MPFLAKLRPLLILIVLGLLVVIGTGQFMKVLKTPVGKTIAIFTVWFIACIPFAAWPGGSFQQFTDVWYKSALICFMTAGLVTTLPQANRVYHTIAYAVAILSVITLLKNYRDPGEGRLALDDTRYQNSNDLAWTLLVGLTFVGFLYLRGTRFQKVIAVLSVPPMLLCLSRTGSRTGMLGAGLLLIVMLLQAKRATRIRLLAALPIVFVAVLFVMPKELLIRYTSFFGDFKSYNYADINERAAAGGFSSTESRKQLLIDSLIITMQHPLLGVGPGNFIVVQNELAQARGELKGSWHVTHNTYTQISSEMGVPGLIIYLFFLFYLFKVLNSIVRTRYPGPTWQNLRQLALTLRTVLIVYLPVSFFDSLAYNTDLMIIAGLATALGFMAQKQRAIDRAARAQAIPAEPLLEPGLEPVAVGQY